MKNPEAVREPGRPAQRGAGGKGRDSMVSLQRTIAVRVVFFLLVLSVTPWRDASIFDGGVDFVDVGKALVAVLGATLAAVLVLGTRSLTPIGIGPAATVIVILLVSLLGAVVAGNESATAVVVIRILIAMLTVLLVLTAVPWTMGVAGLLSAMAVIAVIAAITGIPSLSEEGRLAGGIPQIHPNELAWLAGAPAVGIVGQILRSGLRLTNAVAASCLLAIVVATGSRTGLLAVAASIVVSVLVNGIRQRSLVVLLLGALPIAYSILLFTDVLEGLATRAGSTDTTSSLESRFDAWKVVLGWSWGSWQRWLGLGLSEKTVAVDIKWRDVQVLDSSWVSVLAQAGVLGTALLIVLLGWAAAAVWASGRRRQVVMPLLTLLLLRSLTESGLVDAASPFVMILVLSTALTRRSRHEDFRAERQLE